MQARHRKWEGSVVGLALAVLACIAIERHVSDRGRPDSDPSKSPGGPVAAPPGPPHRGAAAKVLWYLLSAAPAVTGVVLVLGILTSRPVMTTVLSRGNVLSLFLAMVPLFTPLLVWGSAYLWATRSGMVWANRRPVILASVVGIGAVGLVPVAYALVNVALVLGLIAIERPGRLTRVASLVAGLAALSVGVTLTFSIWKGGPSGWTDVVPRALVGRVLAGLPRELVVLDRPADSRAGYVVAVDDEAVTLVDRYPPIILMYSNTRVRGRLSCRLSNNDGWSQDSTIRAVLSAAGVSPSDPGLTCEDALRCYSDVKAMSSNPPCKQLYLMVPLAKESSSP